MRLSCVFHAFLCVFHAFLTRFSSVFHAFFVFQVVGAAETRAHAVMLNVVASLLRRLKMAVLSHPALSQVVLKLIRFATDPTMLSQGREELLDDGLTLWYSSLRSYV